MADKIDPNSFIGKLRHISLRLEVAPLGHHDARIVRDIVNDFVKLMLIQSGDVETTTEEKRREILQQVPLPSNVSMMPAAEFQRMNENGVRMMGPGVQENADVRMIPASDLGQLGAARAQATEATGSTEMIPPEQVEAQFKAMGIPYIPPGQIPATAPIPGQSIVVGRLAPQPVPQPVPTENPQS